MSNKKKAAALLCLVSALSFPACGDDKTTIIGGGGGTDPSAGIQASPATVAFDHVVGRTACPQMAGSFRVTNTTTAQKTLVFRKSAGAPLVLSAGAVLVAGGSQEVPILFDCSQTTPFEATIAVEVDGRTAATVTVRGNVRR